jgi:hypothetical protein
MTFTEFSESCKSKFAKTNSGVRDRDGNNLLDKAKIKRQHKKFKRQLKLHKDAFDR